MERWVRARFLPNLPLYDGKYVTGSEEHIALSLRAAMEGMVLLKNENKTLPLAKGCRIAAFGKGTFDMVKGGGGSGDVHCRFITTLDEGLRSCGGELFEPLSEYYRKAVREQYENGSLPGMTVEPPVPEDLLEQAARWTDTAVFTVSRFSGEGWDRSDVECNEEFNPWPSETSMPQIAGKIFPRGDFYLTDEEKAVAEAVCARFTHVIVVLNTGGMVETDWIRGNDRIGAALLAWQGGMCAGTAAAKLLFGEQSPSGKLPDTFARTLEDYPSTEHFHESHYYVDYTEDVYVGYRYFETLPGAADRVVYPFGYGLSYTSFQVSILDGQESGGRISFRVRVTNSGDCCGKEVVQLYYEAPQGVIGKPARALGAFAKTRLLAPGESEEVTLSLSKDQMASFDDAGRIAQSAYVLEAGDYIFYVGTSVRDVCRADYVYRAAEPAVIRQLSSLSGPSRLKQRLRPDGSMEAVPCGADHDKDACVFEKMEPGTEEALDPEEYGRKRKFRFDAYAPGVRPLSEVAEGRMTLEEFLAQMKQEDLIRLLGGCANTGVANTYGFGGLPEYGIPAAMTADGPAGVRIEPVTGVRTTAFPCQTLLASSWNEELLAEVGKAAAEELKENNLCVWLAPAMNIHRNPMCGRNFEYFSEDPFLTGKLAAAEVRGIQTMGVSACVKHFAANNKETNRKQSDSRVSERALREIYLKAFEIVVKEADPWALMTSYNIINGRRASENRELLEGILRGEWNFGGMVTTDWWTRGEHYKEILAGNDVKMGCGFPERVQKAVDLGAVTRADLEACAARVLGLILKLD